MVRNHSICPLVRKESPYRVVLYLPTHNRHVRQRRKGYSIVIDREDPGTAVRLHLVDSVLFTPLLYLRLRRCGIGALALPHLSILVELYFRLPRTSLALDIF